MSPTGFKNNLTHPGILITLGFLPSSVLQTPSSVVQKRPWMGHPNTSMPADAENNLTIFIHREASKERDKKREKEEKKRLELEKKEQKEREKKEQEIKKKFKVRACLRIDEKVSFPFLTLT